MISTSGHLFSTYLFEAKSSITHSLSTRLFTVSVGQKGQGFHDAPIPPTHTNLLRSCGRLDKSFTVQRAAWSASGPCPLPVQEEVLDGIRWSFETTTLRLNLDPGTHLPCLRRVEDFPPLSADSVVLPVGQLWTVVLQYQGAPVHLPERLYLRLDLHGEEFPAVPVW